MKLYRYERDHSEEENTYQVNCIEFEIIRETEKGYWVDLKIMDRPKFVLKGDVGKRFAYSTKRAALNNFIARTNRSILISKAMITESRKYLETAESLNLD